ncbi:DUF4184 family protein [Brachybacterium sp. EF45031]|uniref:DUF4184 family protein n=1 Tax=Brachybacterium sillae TaxID=2810536 RepID=UPI00217D0CD9|nr:DUF4184 family protein [Brachybacterium sillae]MCS6711518.1 DUF4184 family protein [Brachybacterium sillae]
MPYTLAHPLFAVPLRRLGLPVAGLAIGAMTPDVPLFLGSAGPRTTASLTALGLTYEHTHTIPGILIACLGTGAVLWALWLLVRWPLADALPRRLRDGLVISPTPTPTTPAGVLRAVVALWMGAATHVGLDQFTHEGGWAWRNVAWFREVHAGLPGTSWLQYGLSLLGSMGVALLILRALHTAWLRGADTSDPRPVRHSGQVPARWLVRAALLGGLAAGLTSSTSAVLTGPLTSAVFTTVTRVPLLLGLALCAAALVWHLLRPDIPADRARASRPDDLVRVPAGR